MVYKRSKDPEHYRQTPVESVKGHDYADKDTIRGSREHVDMLDGDKRRTRDSSLSKVNNMQPPSTGKTDRGSSGRLSSRQERSPRDASSSRRSPTTIDRDKSKEGLDVYHGETSRSPSVSSRHKIRNASPTVKDEGGRPIDSSYGYSHSVSSHLDPSTAAGRNLSTKTNNNNNNNNRKKMENLRADSLSSDPSDCARPPPPKPHKHRKGNKKQRQHSLSSSDDEIRSTPENSSYEGEEESESIVSEKGK